MKKRLLCALALSLAILPMTPGTGLSRSPEDSLKEQLLAVALVAQEAGYEVSGDLTKIDVLGHDAKELYTMTLSRDFTYKIVGVCDDDCDDMDLIVFDEKDNVVGRDTSRDSLPEVNIRPKWNGKFKLVVHMCSCADAPCAYGVTILRK